MSTQEAPMDVGQSFCDAISKPLSTLVAALPAEHRVMFWIGMFNGLSGFAAADIGNDSTKQALGMVIASIDLADSHEESEPQPLAPQPQTH